METRNSRKSFRGGGGGRRTSIDELALVKSAAWAWYQHGSGSDETRSSSSTSFHFARAKTPPKPSRYKLEAMKQDLQVTPLEGSHYCYSSATKLITTSTSSSSSRSPSHHHHNSLLDKYEIERISRELDYYIESTHARFHDNPCRRNNNQARIMSSSGNHSGTSDESKIDNNKPRGFRLRPAVFCGSRAEDVVDAVRYNNTNKDGSSSRWPENRVSVVCVATCRPRSSSHGK